MSKKRARKGEPEQVDYFGGRRYVGGGARGPMYDPVFGRFTGGRPGSGLEEVVMNTIRGSKKKPRTALTGTSDPPKKQPKHSRGKGKGKSEGTVYEDPQLGWGHWEGAAGDAMWVPRSDAGTGVAGELPANSATVIAEQQGSANSEPTEVGPSKEPVTSTVEDLAGGANN